MRKTKSGATNTFIRQKSSTSLYSPEKNEKGGKKAKSSFFSNDRRSQMSDLPYSAGVSGDFDSNFEEGESSDDGLKIDDEQLVLGESDDSIEEGKHFPGQFLTPTKQTKKRLV